MSDKSGEVEIISEDLFTAGDTGKIFSWKEVAEIHKTRNGIYQRGGQLISLLTDFGQINPCYPDFQGETPETIFYTGAGRRGDQKLDVYNQALLAAVRSRVAVPLFCKLRVNAWQFMGFWRVTGADYVFEEQAERRVWSFVLEKAAGD